MFSKDTIESNEDLQEDNKLSQKKPSPKGLLIDLIQVVVTALVLTFIILIFIQPSIVDGNSMYPTLHNNDKLILWKLGDIEQGDIVVFDSHDAENNKYVKRVIGVAGDHIVISNSTITVNDIVLSEPYINEVQFGGEVDLIVPEDHIYVLGDNRNHSNDSRIFGPVALKDVSGKMIFNFDKTIRSVLASLTD